MMATRRRARSPDAGRVGLVQVHVLASGSSGNALLVETASTRILVDAGIGPRALAARSAELGIALHPRGVDAIVVTHSHGDHVGRLGPAARSLAAPVYAHGEVELGRLPSGAQVVRFDRGADLKLGDVKVTTLAVPHDAPQVALRFEAGGSAFAVVTDLGAAPRGLDALLASSDVALVEANHCPRMLEDGPYPERLRARVAGPLGHLSNEQTAALLASTRGGRLRRAYLGHISRRTNSCARALAVVAPAAPFLEVAAVPHGVAMSLDLA